MKFFTKPTRYIILYYIILLVSAFGIIFYATNSVNSKPITPKPLISSHGVFDQIVEGDINFDGKVDIMDIVLLIDHLKKFHAMDMNNDKKVNMKDIELLIKQIFGSSAKIK